MKLTIEWNMYEVYISLHTCLTVNPRAAEKISFKRLWSTASLPLNSMLLGLCNTTKSPPAVTEIKYNSVINFGFISEKVFIKYIKNYEMLVQSPKIMLKMNLW